MSDITPVAYTPEETAELLRASRRTVFRWISSGYIKSTLVGGKRLVSRAEIDRLIGEHTEPHNGDPEMPRSQQLRRLNSITPSLLQGFDMPAKVRELLDDLDTLRDWSSVTDPKTGQVKIRSPQFFAQQASMRRDLLEFQAKTAVEMARHQQSAAFSEAILAEIAKESPAVADRILARLAALYASSGIGTLAVEEASAAGPEIDGEVE